MKYRISSNKRSWRLLQEIRYFIKRKHLKAMKNVFYLTGKAIFCFQEGSYLILKLWGVALIGGWQICNFLFPSNNK